MDTDDIIKLAKFLVDDYPFDVRVTVGACPVCFQNGQTTAVKTTRDSKLDSPTSRHEARRKRFEMWMELFKDGGLDPIQCLNVYIPAANQYKQTAKISHPLIITTKLGEPCADKSKCFPLCLICNTTLDHHPSSVVAPWTSSVHNVCCDPCGFTPPGAARGVCCKTPALTIPRLFQESLGIVIRCPKHSLYSKEKPEPAVKARSAPSPAAQATPVPARPAQQPKTPKQRKLLSIERVKETGSHHIGKMMCPDLYASAKKKPEEAPRPMFQPEPSNGPGAAFFYGAKHFDFSEPKRIPIVPDSGDLAHQKDEDEAGPSAADGEDGAP